MSAIAEIIANPIVALGKSAYDAIKGGDDEETPAAATAAGETEEEKAAKRLKTAGKVAGADTTRSALFGGGTFNQGSANGRTALFGN
jgi:hypothetical protein